MALDRKMNDDGLVPYFWIYAPVAGEIELRHPKKHGHHKTLSDLIAQDEIFKDSKGNPYWGRDTIIPIQKRKIILWEQTHPLPNGSDFPEQVVHDVDCDVRLLAQAVSQTVKNNQMNWGGRGLRVAKNMTSASLSLTFNSEAEDRFQIFLDDMADKIADTGLHVGDHRAGNRVGAVKLARRPISKRDSDAFKDLGEKLADRFKRMNTTPFNVGALHLGMSLYNYKGERVRSRDVAIIRPNGLVKWQGKSLTKQRLLGVA